MALKDAFDHIRDGLSQAGADHDTLQKLQAETDALKQSMQDEINAGIAEALKNLPQPDLAALSARLDALEAGVEESDPAPPAPQDGTGDTSSTS